MKFKKIFLASAISISTFSFAQIQKVEPAFWWKGMKNPDLQILVYGKNIANQTVELSDGIQVKNVIKVDNPNYVFLTVDTNKINVSKFKINLKNGKKLVNSYDYELKQRNPNSALRKGFNSSDVIYLIMSDRFANGDPKNDSTNETKEKANRNFDGGRHGGDISGIIKNLDYIDELGATAIWCTPLTEDNEVKYSYHGYAASDLYKIDSRFGTNDDFKKLGDELHKRDMKLIMDFVPNHWGISHWMIQDLPSKDWIHYWNEGENGFKRSNYRQTTQFDSNTSEIDRLGNENGWFDTTMPDMNDRNPLVVNYLVQNAIWWTEFAGLDGIRVDTFPYNSKNGISEWTKRVMEEYPNFNIVGESLMHSPAHISFWQKNSKISEIQNYNSYLPTVMDFPLNDVIATAINENEEGWDKGMVRIYDVLTNDFLYPDINNLMILLDNHDVNRINESLNGDISKYKLAISLLATLRGIPQIYYGGEIGMRGSKSVGDGDIRRDFPGGWNGDKQNAFIDAGRTDEQKEYFNFTKKILNWRKTNSAVHFGKTTHYAPQNNVYLYFRHNENGKVMVIINNSDKEQTIDLNRFAENLMGISKGKDIISDKEISLHSSSKLIIPKKSPLILELR